VHKKEILASEALEQKDETYLDALELAESCARQWLITEDDGTVSHAFMSVEERLCDFLVKAGELVPVDGKRGVFRWVKDD
jgi:hypothetical protein